MRIQDDVINLAPTDIPWLRDDCTMCFRMKYRYGFPRPKKASNPNPIFSKMAAAQSKFFKENVNAIYTEKQVKSCVIEYGGRKFRIKGRLDMAIATRELVYVPDFKSTSPNLDNVDKYWMQLMCYAFCLTNPSEDKKSPQLKPAQIGIVYFDPTKEFTADRIHGTTIDDHVHTAFQGQKAAFHGIVGWIEFDLDYKRFLKRLEETVLELITSPLEPETSCQYCSYGMNFVKVFEKKKAIWEAQDDEEET